MIQVDQPSAFRLFDGTMLRVIPDLCDHPGERIIGFPVEKRQLALHLGQVALTTFCAVTICERLVRCTNAYKNIGQTRHVNSSVGRKRTKKYSIFFTLLQVKTAFSAAFTCYFRLLTRNRECYRNRSLASVLFV